MTSEDRIDDLERRFSNYHEWLVDSIAARDRLALDAAWGVHGSSHSSIAVLSMFLTFHFFNWSGWLAWFGLGVAIVVVEIAVRMWSNGERVQEAERFAKLPVWKSDWN